MIRDVSETMKRLKVLSSEVLNRWKISALTELDPRNPSKNRLLSAWGMLISGSLLNLVDMAFCLMLLKHND